MIKAKETNVTCVTKPVTKRPSVTEVAREAAMVELAAIGQKYRMSDPMPIGRPKVHADRAAKQKAYRERKRAGRG